LKRGAKADFELVTTGTSSCVVVFHEIWGLVAHTRDVCKRLGKLGFAVYAPNLYRGHDDILTPDNIEGAMQAVWGLSLEERRNREKVIQTLADKEVASETREATLLLYDPEFRNKKLERAGSCVEEITSSYEKVATLGFCMGGGLSLKTAARTRDLTSAISFYGEPPGADMLTDITVPMLAVFANHDEIINQRVPAFVGTALDTGKDLTAKTYPRTKHGFFNESRKNVYNRKAADDSWDLLRWFLAKTIG